MSEWLEEEELSKLARMRNLKISIAKGILEKKFDWNRQYTQLELTEYFGFRKSDIIFYWESFFDADENGYLLKTELCEWINKVLEKHNAVVERLQDAEAIYEQCFGRIEDEFESNNNFNYDWSKLNNVFENKLKPVIQVIHWGRLPIIPEYLMVNSGRIPEDDVVDFYDHYHMLQQLRREIQGDGAIMNIKGDFTLDRVMTFAVYTRRHGYKDYYRVMRTIEGWDVRHIAINGKTEKDGTGALISNLKHDSVFFPEEGLRHAMELLWNDAEEGLLTFEELQLRLQQVADWVSEVEKSVGVNQPDWVGYY